MAETTKRVLLSCLTILAVIGLLLVFLAVVGAGILIFGRMTTGI